MTTNIKIKLKPFQQGFFVSIKNSKKPFFIKTLKYYTEFAQLVEAIKVEGYCNKNGNISIDNKDLKLSQFFERLFRIHKIVPGKRKIIKIKLKKIEKQNIIVYENTLPRKFHLEKGFKSNKPDKIVFSTSKNNSKIKISQNGKNILSFSLNDKNLESKFIRKYFTLKFSNKALASYLRLKLNDKFGFDKIHINKSLKNSSSSTITKVFGVLVDCEGSIRFNKNSTHYQNINIRMKNKNYLSDWKTLLKKLNINSSLIKEKDLWKLIITCNQNFKKLHDFGFELHHSKKKVKFKKMLNSYEKHQFERNTALIHYQQTIKEHPGKSTLELASITNKKKRTVSHYLIKLFKSKKITRKLITKQKFVYYSK